MNDSQLDSNYSLTTPVLLMMFNRPNTAQRVFEAIRGVKPRQLYISADGPRADKPDDEGKCQATRQIVTNVDWDCEVKTLFHQKNLGCRKAVTSAIDWFFDNVEEGIILEDDCLPSQSFFWFCQELLERYRHDERVLHIGGNNPIDTNLRSQTYYFSKYNRVWGWASWKRAWKYFDYQIKLWPEIRDKKIHYKWFTRKEAKIMERGWNHVSINNFDVWDYQWFFCRLMHGKAIIPCVNLISNIGFNKDATHTFHPISPLSNLTRGEIIFPLKHPQSMIEDFKRDAAWSKNFVVGRRIYFLKKILMFWK